MHLLCDLEIHSKYARAVSKFMDVPEMARWAKWKGIDVLGTGDFTHPVWLKELKAALTEDGTGLLRLKDDPDSRLRFMLTGELSSIYSQGGKGRRIHTIVVAPSFAAVEALIERVGRHGSLKADGRPILGMSCKQLLAYVLEVNDQLGLIGDPNQPDYLKKPGAYIIPAHVWTPWFGLYGSKSGFDSIEECFEELAPQVRAIETGLSSDIPMNVRLSKNDRLALVSFSDAHSAPNLMREATLIQANQLSYGAISQALQNPRKVADIAGGVLTSGASNNGIIETLEFFPEEGKYHFDGIASEKLRLHPQETIRLRQTDPLLAKKVTVGVLSRVEALADRPEGYIDPNRPSYRSIIPLQEIIADVRGVSKQSKKVKTEYEQLVAQASEYEILVKMNEAELSEYVSQPLIEAILAVRSGEVEIQPGYDGIFGTISIQKKGSQLSLLAKNK